MGQWRLFNVLRRLLGLGASFAGIVTVASFGLGLPAPGMEAVQIVWPSLLSGAVVALLGAAFLILPSYRPDLGDTKVVVNPLRAPRRRTWWTGDPVP